MFLFLLLGFVEIWPLTVRRNVSFDVLKYVGWNENNKEKIKSLNDAIWELNLIRHFRCASTFTAYATYESGSGRWFDDITRFNLSDLKNRFSKHQICDMMIANKTAISFHQYLLDNSSYSAVNKLFGMISNQYVSQCMYSRVNCETKNKYEF